MSALRDTVCNLFSDLSYKIDSDLSSCITGHLMGMVNIYILYIFMIEWLIGFEMSARQMVIRG